MLRVFLLKNTGTFSVFKLENVLYKVVEIHKNFNSDQIKPLILLVVGIPTKVKKNKPSKQNIHSRIIYFRFGWPFIEKKLTWSLLYKLVYLLLPYQLKIGPFLAQKKLA